MFKIFNFKIFISPSKPLSLDNLLNVVLLAIRLNVYKTEKENFHEKQNNSAKMKK